MLLVWGNVWGLDSDNGEDVYELSQTFSLLRDSDSINTNIFAAAYIRPEYNWASQYKNENVPFTLNLSCDQASCVDPIANQSRDTDGYERDDFWIAYILIGYQPIPEEDFDPSTEKANSEITSSADYDDDTTNSQGVRSGADGSIVFIETSRDWGQFVPISFQQPTPHGIGHQLGLKGDDPGQSFGIMNPDAFDPPGVTNPYFVRRHLNILRWRIPSPGK